MAQDATITDESTGGQATAHVVHSLYKFLRVIRYRKGTVLVVMGLCLAIGLAYFATATRYYGSSAQLLVVDTANSGGIKRGQSPEDGKRSMMATFVNLLVSPRVVDGAIKHLDKKYLVDLEGVSRGNWVQALKKNLSSKSIRGTNILEVRYRSREPAAAAAVVSAVVDSYLKFMNETHSNTASRAVRVLHSERVNLQESLAEAERRYIQVSRQNRNIGLGKNHSEVHPAVRRALRLNEDWVKLTAERLKVASALNALQYSLRVGEDIHQHVLMVEETVGRQVMLSILGMSQQDAANVAKHEQDLLDYHAELRTKLKILDVNHPIVDELKERIAGRENFLLTYRDKARRELERMADQELGPLLDKMLQQQLEQVTAHERSVRFDFEKAQDFAVELNVSLYQLKNIENEIAFYNNLLDELIKQLAKISEVEGYGGITTARTQYPRVDANPVWPKLPFIGFVSLFFGLPVAVSST
jgi:uncharacterized protein involved in exopolysaccharide biosynthesis